MKIITDKTYIKDYKKKIVYKHMQNEIERIRDIENLILDSEDLKALMLNPLRIIYGIEQKKEI